MYNCKFVVFNINSRKNQSWKLLNKFKKIVLYFLINTERKFSINTERKFSIITGYHQPDLSTNGTVCRACL